MESGWASSPTCLRTVERRGARCEALKPTTYFCLDKVAAAKDKEGAIQFVVERNTLVWSMVHKQAFPLWKLVQDVYPSTRSIIGYEAFGEVGKCPKELKKETARAMTLVQPESVAVWQAASGGEKVKAMFVMRLEDAKSRLVPAGVALVNTNQWTVPKGDQPEECA